MISAKGVELVGSCWCSEPERGNARYKASSGRRVVRERLGEKYLLDVVSCTELLGRFCIYP